MLIYVHSQAGIGKPQNEDAVLAGSKLLRQSAVVKAVASGFIAVADGVGGHADGAFASSFVLGKLLGLRFNATELSAAALRTALTDINHELIAASNDNPQRANTATTLTALCLNAGGNYLIHIADTRAWLKQGRYLKQLTTDNTLKAELEARGLTDEAAHTGKNVITACFGGGNRNLLNKLSITPLTVTGRILLTSDGIHDYVATDVLEDIMERESDPAVMCRQMAEHAVAAGSLDDISAVITDI